MESTNTMRKNTDFIDREEWCRQHLHQRIDRGSAVGGGGQKQDETFLVV